MTGFLIDTNVVSELRRKQPAPEVVGWFAGVDESAIFLSVLTLGELWRGVERLRPRDPDQAEVIGAWLGGIEEQFQGHVLTVDVEVARRWGHISARRPVATVDALLAATAIEHDLTVVTRNERDFDGLGVPVLNPFEVG